MGCREEVLDAAASLIARSEGAPFSPADVVTELAGRRSRYAEQTIRTHVVSHLSSGQGSPLVRVDRGLYVLRESGTGVATDATAVQGRKADEPARAWPWEGAVQAVFASVLRERGWEHISLADTATKAPGVDVLAHKGERRLGAEVKAWPSSGYADPRRAAEVKRTQPSTQAGHWFAQALLKALMLRDSHPDHESLVVLPDYPRYRHLADRTRTGRRGAHVHVVLLDSTGQLTSENWTP